MGFQRPLWIRSLSAEFKRGCDVCAHEVISQAVGFQDTRLWDFGDRADEAVGQQEGTGSKPLSSAAASVTSLLTLKLLWLCHLVVRKQKYSCLLFITMFDILFFVLLCHGQIKNTLFGNRTVNSFQV